MIIEWFDAYDEESIGKDDPLDFSGDIPMCGRTVDGAEYKICADVFWDKYNVWLITFDETHEYHECVFKGTKNECKNYVWNHMEVEE